MKYYAKVLTTKNNHVTKTTSNQRQLQRSLLQQEAPRMFMLILALMLVALSMVMDCCPYLFLRGKELPTTPIRTPIL